MGRAEDLFEPIEARGEGAIDELIASRKSEELFLDFKRSSDSGAALRLSDNDRNNLAKSISGFGNSEGGVVVWGVDCSSDYDGADVAKMKVSIQDPARFVSWLEGAVSGSTVPPHQGVRSIPVVSSVGSRFAVTLVPKSNHAPHQVVGRFQYFIRAGSAFVPTPHAVLAGMFGRVPQPHVFPYFTVGPGEVVGDAIACSVGIVIRNEGPGIATDLFANVLVVSFPEAPSSFAFEFLDRDNWSAIWSFGRDLSIISKPGYRLPPQGQAGPLLLKLRLEPPFRHAAEVRGMVGAGGTIPSRFTWHVDPQQIEVEYDELMHAARSGTLSDDQVRGFGSRVLAKRVETSVDQS
ncbi:MAG: ATP-binding protein [Acidobacteriota bacterium]